MSRWALLAPLLLLLGLFIHSAVSQEDLAAAAQTPPGQASDGTHFFLKCTKKTVDLVFLFDGSGSMTTAEFNKNKDFIVEIVNSLKNSSIKFAAVQFGTEPRKVFDFSDYKAGGALDRLIEERHMKSLTNTHKALRFVLEQILENTEAGASSDATKVLVLITDGDPSDSDTHGIIKTYDDKSIIRYVIGVRIQSLDKVKTIASEPKDNNAFKIENYDGLTGLLENLRKRIFKIEVSKVTCETSQSEFCAAFNKVPFQKECRENDTPIVDIEVDFSHTAVSQEDPAAAAQTPPGQASDGTHFFLKCTKKTVDLVDLVFLFDGSGSMTTAEFNKNKDFIVEIMDSLKNSSIKFAAVQFSMEPRKVFDFNDYKAGGALDKLKKEPHMKSLTYTHRALTFVLEQILENTEAGASSDATKVLVLITDGASSDRDTHGIIKTYDDKSIIRYVIGVNIKSLDKVKTIASEPKDNNTFKIENYDGLTGLLENLQKRIFKIKGSKVTCETSQSEFCAAFNKVPFQKECRENDTPIADLEVDFNFTTPTLLVGEDKSFNVIVNLRNHGDDSYNTSLTMHYPPGLSFSLMSVIQSTRPTLHKCGDLEGVLDKTVCGVNIPVYCSRSSVTFNASYRILYDPTQYEWNNTMSMTVTGKSDNSNSTKASMTKSLPVQYAINMAVMVKEETTSFMNFTVEDPEPKKLVTVFQVDNPGFKAFPVSVSLFFPTKLEHNFEIMNYQVFVQQNKTQCTRINDTSSEYCLSGKHCKIIECDSFILDKESATEFKLSADVQFRDLKQYAANVGFVKRYTGDHAEVRFKSFLKVSYDDQRYVLNSHKQKSKNGVTKKSDVTGSNDWNDPTEKWAEVRVELIVWPDKQLIILTGVGIGILLLIIFTIILFKLGCFKRKKLPYDQEQEEETAYPTELVSQSETDDKSNQHAEDKVLLVQDEANGSTPTDDTEEKGLLVHNGENRITPTDDTD